MRQHTRHADGDGDEPLTVLRFGPAAAIYGTALLRTRVADRVDELPAPVRPEPVDGAAPQAKLLVADWSRVLQPTQPALTFGVAAGAGADLATDRPFGPCVLPVPAAVADQLDAGRARAAFTGVARSPLAGTAEVSQDAFNWMLRLWVQAAERSLSAPLADPAAALAAARNILSGLTSLSASRRRFRCRASGGLVRS